MTAEYIGTIVNGAHAPHHSGSGDQHINYAITVEKLPRRAPRVDSLSPEQLTWLASRFAAPPGFDSAYQRLVNTRVVLLAGEVGSGCRSAALMLLCRAAPRDARLHEIFDADEPGEPALDISSIEPGRHLFLDLSEISDERYAEVRRELASYGAAVIEQRARLVVVMRPDERTTRPELSGWLVPIGRPAWQDVLARHLEASHLQPITMDLDLPELAEDLGNAPPRYINELVQLTLKQRSEKTTPIGTLPIWLKNALKTLRGRREKVTCLFQTHSAGPGRALLLVAAMLEGMSAAAVPQAVSGFLTATNYYPADERHQLDWPDLAHQLKDVGAEIDNGLRVRFEMPGMADAIRDHFWNVFPTLQPEPAWLVEILGHNSLAFQDRDRLVERFSAQCLRTWHPDRLTSLVERLTGPGNAKRLFEHAVTALASGLSDARYGGFFRRQIRERAADADFGPALAAVMVRVCADVIAETHPDQALVRLHHLARWETRSNAVGACDALLVLAHSRPARLAQLFDRLAIGMSRHKEPDFKIFFAATDPPRLVIGSERNGPGGIEPVVRMPLTRLWTAAMSAYPGPAWADHVRVWLTASEIAPHGRQLLSVLVEAGRGNHKLLSQLYDVACAWAREAPMTRAQRPQVLDQLFHMIEQMQGLGIPGDDIKEQPTSHDS